MSAGTTDLTFMIGVLRKVAKLSIENKSTEQAMLIVANEIEDGLRAWERGETKPVIQKQLLDGDFMGDLR